MNCGAVHGLSGYGKRKPRSGGQGAEEETKGWFGRKAGIADSRGEGCREGICCKAYM